MSIEDFIEIDGNEDESLTLPELPKAGDKLVTKSYSRTDMLWGEWLDWNQYADGYKEAADRVVATINGLPHEDRLLCPIIFLYRHYVELKLKEIVLALDRLGETEIDPKLFIKHDLMLFWSYIRKHLDCIREKPDHSILNPTGLLIKELSELDPDSMHFRYSVNKKFEKMPVPYCLDIKHFSKTMELINQGLAYIEGGIDWEKEGRSLEAEFYADMY